MKKLNCIVVFNKEKDAVLFCKRKKDPYKGLYNFVGGKVEPGESSVDAAYRELWEETGISRRQIRLYHFMDITYYYQDFVLELYAGMLPDDIPLKEEINPLTWLSLNEDFTDPDRFAGEQNIAHIINIALKCPLPICALSTAVQEKSQPKSLHIEAVSIPFSVCKVPDYEGISLDKPFVFSGSTDQERSLVCPTASVPENVIAREDGWRAFRVIGELDFSLIGILADISRLLADKRIGIFAISTYNTDYILTKEADFERALKTLSDAGYMVKSV